MLKAPTPRDSINSISHHARQLAIVIDGAARCESHLKATLSAWDEMTEAEKKESVATALGRLQDGTWVS